MQADEAEAVFDDKGRYARHRLIEEMCKGEAFARPSHGRVAEIRALSVDEPSGEPPAPARRGARSASSASEIDSTRRILVAFLLGGERMDLID